MALNPFIEIARDPVSTLAALAYVVALLTMATAGSMFVIREYTHLWAAASRTNRQREWWGTFAEGWCPPAGWSMRFMRATFVVVLDLMALSALAWVAGL